jgi:mRNA-degrading endonuclease RelE of RelBE toxin-antitoxin system
LSLSITCSALQIRGESKLTLTQRNRKYWLRTTSPNSDTTLPKTAPLGGTQHALQKEDEFIKNRFSRQHSAIFIVDNIVKIPYNTLNNWTVTLSNRAAKRTKKLPTKVKDIFEALLLDLATIGPIQHEWSNYSKLTHDRYHCHLNYSFVAIWEVVDREIRILEITYVGTREGAPY